MTRHRPPALALAVLLALGAAGCDTDTDASTDADATAPADGAAAVDTPPAAGPVPIPEPEPPQSSPEPDATVPERFRGRYAADEAACGSAGHESELEIDGDTIAFHESSGPVTAVSPTGDDIAVTAELTGEGETREATYRFGLSADGDTLTDLDGGMVRVRCDAPST